jgi:hypothetical protein
MLAGLIFATEDAEDSPGALAATLPFGGMTLLEYQARLLIGAGATHILVAVARVTPALLGAVHRAARPGVAVDVVRSAEEAAACIHPLARILVLADGLVTTDAIVDRIAGDGAEALLVTRDAGSAVERVDSEHVWAGLARIPAARLGDVAALPAEYDFQSTLLRMIAQARPEQIQLPAHAVRSGHGVERQGAALASRSNAVLAALTERRTTWADRYVFTRFARIALPQIVARAIPGWTLPVSGGLFALASVALLALGWRATGVALAIPAVALFATGAAMSALRAEDRRAALQENAIGILAAAVILLLGIAETSVQGTATALVLAIALISAAAIAERTQAIHRRWWASPAAYLLVIAPFTIAGLAQIGLALLAIYAAVTLAAAIETLREKP